MDSLLAEDVDGAALLDLSEIRPSKSPNMYTDPHGHTISSTKVPYNHQQIMQMQR